MDDQNEQQNEQQEERSKRAWEAVGVLVPGGLLVGMGIGWIFDQLVPGLFIGLGAGMLLMAALQVFLRK